MPVPGFQGSIQVAEVKLAALGPVDGGSAVAGHPLRTVPHRGTVNILIRTASTRVASETAT